LLDAVRAAPGVRRLSFDTSGLESWDSGLLTFLVRTVKQFEVADIEVDREGLPEGVRKLLDMAFAVPPKTGTGRGEAAAPLLARIGAATIAWFGTVREALAFVGEATISCGLFLTGRAQFRRRDLWLTIQQCGAQALPIVSLISFLIGLILALVGAVQLKLFAAEIYVADLVGLAMTREMGAMMTAIIMAGRTGAAFAAQLGTMTVNEEIDALKTMGFSPIDFLVQPRMLALMLMMPLLCLYADLLGILGGAAVGVGLLGLTPTQYWTQTVAAVGFNDFAIGVVKASVFGAIVALCGCLQGMKCGRSASAVGTAATSAVVAAILLIIVTDAIFTVMCNQLGI
jgi:phospholipid/cholesterol/gamma-HCH transport system permease protein